MRPDVTEELYRGVRVYCSHLAKQLLLAHLFDIFENAHYFLWSAKVVLTLREEKTTDLVVVVREHLAELIVQVLVALFCAHSLKKLDVEPVWHLDVAFVSLLQVNGQPDGHLSWLGRPEGSIGAADKSKSVAFKARHYFY